MLTPVEDDLDHEGMWWDRKRVDDAGVGEARRQALVITT
jgi:hypothetical protein